MQNNRRTHIICRKRGATRRHKAPLLDAKANEWLREALKIREKDKDAGEEEEEGEDARADPNSPPHPRIIM